jgi:transcriptional regulator with XRE-family HTH domain
LIIANVENLVLARALNGWNQKQLALEAGLSAAAITKLESGVPVSPGTVKKIMDAMGSSEVEKYFCYVSGRNKEF